MNPNGKIQCHNVLLNTLLKATNKIDLKEKQEKTPHVNRKVHDIFTCEIDTSLSSSQLRTQIELTGTTGKVLYNALLDT